jgi:shikimate kinase
LGKTLDDFEVVNLGVDAAFDAKVTVTGAFDDACASYFGGLVVTDNMSRSLVMRTSLPEGYLVLFHVPDKKTYTANSDVNRIRTVAPMVKVAYCEATQTNVWTALSLNGLLYSAALGFDALVALDALGAGAVAAGLCGKGPAVTAVVPEEKFDEVKAALERHPGRIVPAQFNHEKASVVT